MSKEYPLYPELPDAGKEEAQALIDKFKKALNAAAGEVIDQLYMDVVPHIESDAWANYRNDMMDGFKDYKNRLVQGEYDFKAIREKIFSEYRADIIKDLDQDNLKRIAELEKECQRLRDMISERPHGRY